MSTVPIRQPRPAAATVLGILHLIFGSLGLMSTLCAGAMQLAGPNLFGQVAKNNPSLALAEAIQNVPGQKAFIAAGLATDLILDVLLIVGGIGLLQMRGYGRSLSLVYAVLSILYHLVALIWQVLTYSAVTEAMDAVIGMDPILKAAGWMSQVSHTVGIVLGFIGIAYPIVVLCFMLSRSLTAAFTGEAPPANAPDDYDPGWGALNRDPLRPTPPPGGDPDDRYKPS